jgi:hypothetical protein
MGWRVLSMSRVAVRKLWDHVVGEPRLVVDQVLSSHCRAHFSAGR